MKNTLLSNWLIIYRFKQTENIRREGGGVAKLMGHSLVIVIAAVFSSSLSY